MISKMNFNFVNLKFLTQMVAVKFISMSLNETKMEKVILKTRIRFYRNRKRFIENSIYFSIANFIFISKIN